MKRTTSFLLFLLLTFVCYCQNNNWIIYGTVKDNYGDPLEAATVIIKGTAIATQTDIDGKYQIAIPPSAGNAPTLVFSSVSFKNKEIKIDGKSIDSVDVRLESDESKMMQEVVVVGYGTQKKSCATGSTIIVRSKSVSKNSKSTDNKKGETWKRSGMPENSIRLIVGDNSNDFLPLQASQVAVQIDGFRVRVLLDCFFFNDKKDRLEGTFKIRLPSGASPYYFAFGKTEYLNDKNSFGKNGEKSFPYTVYKKGFDLSPDSLKYSSRNWNDVKEARIVSKQKAAREYESTVSAQIDPALMEWSGSDMFSCRVYPLEKNTLHRIVIGYDLSMTEALNSREFILSLPEAKELMVNGNIYSTKDLHPTISADVETKLEGDHQVFSIQNPKKKEISFSYDTTKPMMLISKEKDYFATNVRISLPEQSQETLPSDAVFLLDVSLSSQPDKFNIWLKTMDEILSRNKDIIKRFSVLMFNTDKWWWHESYVKNNYYNLNQFMEYANTLALEGATDFGAALAEGSNPSWLSKAAPKHIFVMSDGDFNWGESNMQAIRAVIGSNDRVHTYKTGLSGTNVKMLDYLSRETGGFSFTVTGEEEVELTAKSFRYRPWKIEDVQVDGIEDFMISGEPSQLYNGQKLIFTGRNIPKGDIHIKVNNGLQTQNLVFTPISTIASDLTDRVYGQVAISQLENYSYELDDAIGNYCTEFRIPNENYSFLMLDNEYDYNKSGINNKDAKDYVEENTVRDIVKEFLEKGGASKLGNGKKDFIAWLNRLSTDANIKLKLDSTFMHYVNSLPEETFNVKIKQPRNSIRTVEEQTDDELEALGNENMLYDNMLNVAKKRAAKYDALKLLSSVMEKNSGDFVALRDMAIKAIEWNQCEQAYYMMRRIIANRQYEPLPYLISAQALAKSGNRDLSLIFYYMCLNSHWDSEYGSFKEISALQCSRYMKELVKTNFNKEKSSSERISFLKDMHNSTEDILEDMPADSSDIVILISWNTDNTDVDLHVLEPTGEDCYYANRHTKIDGKLTIDVTGGFGPEMYILKKAPNGKYKVRVELYSEDRTKTCSKSKIYVDFYRNFGLPNEKHLRKTVILQDDKENQDLFEFAVNKKGNDVPKH